jgi:transposase
MILNKPLYLNIHIKRYRCQNCLEVFSQTFDSIQPNQHQTRRFREFLFGLCKETTIQDVSKKQKIPYTTLERIYYSVAKEKAFQHTKHLQDQIEIELKMVIGLDEIAVRKGHRYETMIINLIHSNVIGMNHERSYQSTVYLLETQNVFSSEFVQNIVIDMWDPFHKAVRSLFPHASIVIDQYHVIQKVSQALNQVRKQVQSEQPSLKKGRFILLKSVKKLKDNQLEKLNEYLEKCPTPACAYYLKELFREIYEKLHYDEAEELLRNGFS